MARYALVPRAIVHIMAMLPHIIIIGMPMPIIVVIFWQHSMNMSFTDASIGMISQAMPFAVMVQVIRHIIIGIMPGIIAPIGIMPPIMGMFIIGMFMGIICICGVAFMAGLRKLEWDSVVAYPGSNDVRQTAATAK